MTLYAADAHDACLATIRQCVARLTPELVGRAFVAGLTSRKLAYRSALGSYAVARVLPEHAFVPCPRYYAAVCATCGWSRMPSAAEKEPLEVLAKEREKFGGIRHLDPRYIRFDLEAFSALPALAPSADDWRCLELMLRTPPLLAPDAKAEDLQRALQPLLRSNRNERFALVRTLAVAGVLQPAAHATFFDRYVPEEQRVLPPGRFADWGYPAIWWRAGDGVRAEAVELWFPELAGRRAG